MTELADRLARLADAAVADLRLEDPSITPAVDGRGETGRRSPRVWLIAAAVLLVLAVAALVVVGADGDDEVTVGPSTDAAAVVSVAFRLGPAPLGLRVVVRDEAGAVVAERTSAEVEEPVGGVSGAVWNVSGLLIELLPGSRYTVEVVGDVVSTTCAVGPLRTGDRLVLPVVAGNDGLGCGLVESAEDWAGPSGEVGRGYLGLTEAEAVARVEADGHTAEVSGHDGVDLLANVEDGRVDLKVFDGVVVGARLGDEDLVYDTPRVREALVVVVSSPGGRPEVAGEVQVRVGGEATTKRWPITMADDLSSVGTVFDDVAAGEGVLEVTGLGGPCRTGLEVADGGTIVTIEVEPDGSFPTGGCEPLIETLAEHVDRVTAGWDAYDPVPGYVGLTEAEADDLAREQGRSVRIVSREGMTTALTRDLRPDRVNLVLYGNEVRAAALF